jgi:hypothetical protein
MSVERLLESLLVKVMTNETDRSSEDEESVECTDGEVLSGLLWGEGTRALEEIAEACCDSTVDVEDEGLRCGILSQLPCLSASKKQACTHILLRACNLLNGNSVVKSIARWELLLGESLDKLDSEIRVIDALDLVSDTRDCKREYQVSYSAFRLLSQHNFNSLSLFAFLMESTNSRGLRPDS